MMIHDITQEIDARAWESIGKGIISLYNNNNCNKNNNNKKNNNANNNDAINNNDNVFFFARAAGTNSVRRPVPHIAIWAGRLQQM